MSQDEPHPILCRVQDVGLCVRVRVPLRSPKGLPPPCTDHCSFNTFKTQPGPFPPHCVQGSPGSYLVHPVKKALEKARRKNPHNVHIVFKGAQRRTRGLLVIQEGAMLG